METTRFAPADKAKARPTASSYIVNRTIGIRGIIARSSDVASTPFIHRDHQAKPDGSAPEKVKALAALELAPLNAGVHQTYSGDTVKTFLETFLAQGQGGRGRDLNPTTRASYKAQYDILKDFIPDGLEVRQVRTPHIDKLLRDVAIDDLSEDGERRAQTSYANLKGFLSSAFRYALRHGFTDSNPVRDAAIPQGLDADTHAYTLKEVHKFMQVLDEPVSRALIMVAMFTGLRTEEIKGLKWSDYQKTPEGYVLNIERAVVRGKLVEVKTDSSKAPVAVIKTVERVLAAHLAKNSGDGYIFHGDTGKPLVTENLVRRSIRPTLAAAKVEWHGFHAFRRGIGTILEIDVRHSVEDVTGKHYIKSDVREGRAALERVEKDFLKLKPKLKL